MQTAHGYGSDETALIRAAKKGHIDVVRVLVDAGARICNDMFFHVTLGGVRSSVPAVEFIRMMVDITSTDIQRPNEYVQVLLFNSASASTRARTTSMCPALAAMIRGVSS